ncbi:hypothetical protein RB619_06970 [Flavobacterium sp. LHD-80]|uniref:hypothetical protein n=1 Tax=Flavobacterium sp. LHD-80 TaxID=3071411 RepID=UPI0027E15B33|nr:hypothetical protein [Flavobacterium sp. LHD-80]MDQ6470377.1 hypothetical protein [Flavobacterium sp. LHD-80]
MDRLKYILFIALTFSAQQITFAQKNNSVSELNEVDKKINESIYLSTNANSFLTGEKLLYKVFCIDKAANKASIFSKIAYVQLIDNSKKAVFTHKIFLEKGTGSGDFFLPTTLESGSYKLVGYTSWMLNKNAPEYFSLNLYIINPYKENPSNSTVSYNAVPSETVSNSNISFDLKSKSYNSRDLVEFGIKTNSDEFAQGNYTVSVRKTDGFISQNKTTFNSAEKSVSSEITTSQVILPELRGEIITGKISSTTADIKNKKVALSIVGKNSELQLAKTDDQGRFLFILEKENPNSNIIVQVLESGKEDYVIEIDKQKDLDLSNLTFPIVQFNSDFQKNITDRLISTQIENAYYDVKKDSLITPAVPAPFFGTSSEEFKLDDFTRFPNIEETITEILKGVYYRKNNNEYAIHVFDYDENYESSIPALIVVDGLIIENLNEFFAFSPKLIYKVNVVRGIYYYGSKSFNGIVSFTTKNGDYDTKLKGQFIIRPEILRPQVKKNYFNPDYAISKSVRIPDYRHQLLWQPNIDLSKTNSNIKFYASDVSGTYEVTLEGFSANGKPVFIKDFIEIKEEASN